MSIDPVAKILFGVGFLFLLLAIAWQFGWIQNLRLGRLPGDISIQRENFSFYMPITTCLLLSAIFGFISWLLKR